MQGYTKKTIKYYKDYTLKYSGLLSLTLTGIILGSLSETAKPYFYKIFFDNFSSTNNPSVEFLIKLIFIIGGISLFNWIAWRTAVQSTTYHQTKVMADLANMCFKYLHGHSYRFFAGNFAGSLTRKVNKFTHSYELITDQFFWSLIPVFIRILAICIIVFSRAKILGLLIIAWSVLFIAFNYVFSLFKIKFDLVRAENDTKITATLADTITNNINIKLFTGQNLENKNFLATVKDWIKANLKSWNLTNIGEAIQSFLMILLEFVVFYIAVKLWQKSLITIGDFVMLQAYLLLLFNRLWDLGRNIRRIYESLADAAEMTEILETPHEVKDVQGAGELTVTTGHIEFKNIYFSYGKNKQKVFKNFSFQIASGEKVALVGPSGGGKTTVTRLLLRLYNLDKGNIEIDGQDIVKTTQNSLRANIGLVPQEPILFHRPLLENIRYGKPNSTDEEIIKAAKLAHAHEFIDKLPLKYQTFVGERGIKLSGGERQRVAIARAILKNAPILILDEATSSLDSESEMYIQDALKKLLIGKTSIIIAHRLSTIMQADRIVVIENGQITEEGKHAELLKAKSGTYQKLWKIQAGGFTA